MSDMITVQGRTINTITAEIIVLTQQAQASALASACQIGKRLVEAKKLVDHGEWGDYLKNEVAYSQSTANNFMRLFRELGENPNSQAIGNLNPTQALRLLALPAEEREGFAQEHDVAAMTTRELEQQIRDHKARAEKAEADAAAKADLLAVATEENGALRQRLDGIDADYKAQLDVVDKENDDLRAKLADAKSRPAKISDADAEKLRAEGRKAGEAAAAEQIRKAQEEADAKEEARADMEAALVEAQRQLTELKSAKPEQENTVLSDPDAAAFNVYLQQVGETVNKMIGHFRKTQMRDPELAARMLKALRAFSDRFAETVAKLEVLK